MISDLNSRTDELHRNIAGLEEEKSEKVPLHAIPSPHARTPQTIATLCSHYDPILTIPPRP